MVSEPNPESEIRPEYPSSTGVMSAAREAIPKENRLPFLNATRRTIVKLTLLAIISTAWMLTYFHHNPPLFGDVYEYAQVARNLVEDGQAREDFLRYPSWVDTEIPHPAKRRFNALTILYAGAYLLFGRSYWTVCLPFLVSFALLPFVVFIYARQSHSERVALAAAALMLFQPRLLLQFSVDPMGDLFILIFLLLSVAAFRRRSPIACGVFLGLAVASRETSLLLALSFGLAVWLGKRRYVDTKRVATGVAAFLVVVGPFALRNLALTRSPISTSEFSMLQAFENPNLPDRSVFYTDYHFPTLEETRARAPLTAGRVLRLVAANAKHVLLGYQIEYSYVAGLIELVTLPLLFFAFYFLVRKRSRLREMPEVWAFILTLAAHVVLVVRYEERYLVFPVCLAIVWGLAGLESIRSRPRLFEAVLVAVLLVEVFPATFSVGTHTLDMRGRQTYRDMRTVIERAVPALPTDAVWATAPAYAFGFYADRLNVPLPLDPWQRVRAYLAARRVRGLFVTDLTGKGPLPGIPRLEPLALGCCNYAYRVGVDIGDTSSKSTAMANFRFLSTYMGIGLSNHFYTSPAVRAAIDYGVPGILGYAFTMTLFVIGYIRAESFLARFVLSSILAVAALRFLF